MAPLFRSEQQLAILAVLFADGASDVPIGELADRAGVAQATASREVARLAEHGLVITRPLGRNTLVTANWSLSWAKELQSILLQTVGVLGRLGDVLRSIGGIEEAYIFGSWAARYTGEPGPPPRDIDVVVVGSVPLRNVRRACRSVEEELRIDVNPVVVDPPQWHAAKVEPFIAQIKGQPLVQIALDPQ